MGYYNNNFSEIVSIEEIGEDETYDITNYEECYLGEPNFIAGGMIVHNSMGLVDSYCKRKNGDERTTYFIPEFEEVLKDTYGIIVYQEQLMLALHKILGISFGAADVLRRAMEGFNNDTVDKYVKQAKENPNVTLSPKEIDETIAYLKDFAGYSFNKAHSASYSLTSYWSMYLKAHFPVEFSIATLNKCKKEDLPTYLKDFTKIVGAIGVTFSYIDINNSRDKFMYNPEVKKIYYGFNYIDGIGESVSQELMKHIPFKSLTDFFSDGKVDWRKINKGAIERLIKIGAFDELQEKEAGHINRKALLFASMLYKNREDIYVTNTQLKEVLLSNKDFATIIDRISVLSKEQKQKGKKGTLDINLAQELRNYFAKNELDSNISYVYKRLLELDVKEFSKEELMEFEKQYYGFCLTNFSKHKYQALSHDEQKEYPLKTISQLEVDENCVVIARIAIIEERKTKKDNLMYNITIEDETGSTNIIAWSNTIQKFKPYFKTGKIVMLKLSGNMYGGKLGFSICDEFNSVLEAK